MDITPLIAKGRQVISHYGNGGFTVNGTVHKGNILIAEHEVMSWEVNSAMQAQPDSLAPLLMGEVPEIVLIGMGSLFMPMPRNLKAYLKEKGIASDAMDTGAACRTYSVLLTEGRAVAAALIAV